MLNGWIGRGPLRAPGTLLTMSDIPSEASEATLKSIRGGLTLPGGLPGINSVPDRCGVLSCAGYYSCNCLRGQEPCSRSTQGPLRSVCCQRVRASERGRGLPVCLLACLQVSPHHPLATTDNPAATHPSLHPPHRHLVHLRTPTCPTRHYHKQVPQPPPSSPPTRPPPATITTSHLPPPPTTFRPIPRPPPSPRPHPPPPPPLTTRRRVRPPSAAVETLINAAPHIQPPATRSQPPTSPTTSTSPRNYMAPWEPETKELNGRGLSME